MWITKILSEPNYSIPTGMVLSSNQKKFVRDAKRQGLVVKYHYSGKHMRPGGRTCPAVEIFRWATNKFKTSARTSMDFKEHKGKVYGVTVYAFS